MRVIWRPSKQRPAADTGQLGSASISGIHTFLGVGSQVVSLLDAGAEGLGSNRNCDAVLLRVARVTAGLAESNGSLPSGL